MASTAGTRTMIVHFAPEKDRPSWVSTLKEIRALPERRSRGRWV